MKKALCMVALAAISFGSVFAHGTVKTTHGVMQTDTTKKKMKHKKSKDGKMKKDTTSKM